MAIDKTLKEYSVGVDAGWLMAYSTLKGFVDSNPTASLQDALAEVDAAHKPAVTLAQIIANEDI
jgi:hypothetical protein